MELDELKSAWQALERKLDRQHALELRHLRTDRLASARRGLWPLIATQVLQAAFGIALMAGFAPYWVRHWGEWHLVAYGVSLHLYGLLIALFAGRDLVRIAQVDYAAPVVEIQKRLAVLRAQRIAAVPVLAYAGCVAWVPLVLVGFRWLGADLWIHKPAMVAWFLASAVVSVLVAWAVFAWTRAARNAKLRRDLDDQAAGRALTRAQAALEEIARFERE